MDKKTTGDKPCGLLGQENPITTIQSSKFYEVQPYLTISRHVYIPWGAGVQEMVEHALGR